jgi:CDP-diacylglycerol--serine O-phosphatidyltransferase
MLKKHIPNAITCANLFSGCIGIVFAFQGNLEYAAYFVVLSGIFDFFDGMVARWLDVKSAIGKELDSLADMVSFGLLPGVVMYQLLCKTDPLCFGAPFIAYLGFIITIFSALRLAKFNIDTRQTEEFFGLNTPTNTFLIVSLPFIIKDYPLVGSPILLLAIIIVTSFLLVSEIQLFSLKLSDKSWAKSKFKYIFLIISVILIAVLQFTAVPFILVLYIAMSVLHFKVVGNGK